MLNSLPRWPTQEKIRHRRGSTATHSVHGNGKGGLASVAWRDLRALFDCCGCPELPRRDAHETLEVTGELALVPEAGVRGDLRQRHSRFRLVTAGWHENDPVG